MGELINVTHRIKAYIHENSRLKSCFISDPDAIVRLEHNVSGQVLVGKAADQIDPCLSGDKVEFYERNRLPFRRDIMQSKE